MSVATPVLGGVPLPQVAVQNGCTVTVAYLGGQSEMASGAYSFDLFSTAQKRRFELTWVAMTEAQVATILTAWAALLSGSAEFVPPLGDTAAAVQRDGEISVNWFGTAGGARADVSMRLREL